MIGLNNLPRDVKGIRVDVRGNRDLAFNNWHRANLPNWCYVTDVDFLEYRFEGNKIVLKAIFEIKEWHVTESKYIEDCANFKAIKKLVQEAKLPFYFVWYEKDEMDIKRFKVWDVLKEEKKMAKEMTAQEFKQFIEVL